MKPSVEKAAQALSARIRGEDGVKTAVGLLEEFIG
jgi:hypothetical protein